MYVYIRSEPQLWTVGFYAPDGAWHTDSDHGDREEAAKRVHYLNGANDTLASRTSEVELQVAGAHKLIDRLFSNVARLFQ